MSKSIMDISSRQEAIDNILKDKIVSLEFADVFLGEFLGSGASRYVFQCQHDKKKVVKIDMSCWGANSEEYKVWQKIAYVKKVNNWFAQCPVMSRFGSILFMEKADMGRCLEDYPKLIPSFFTDIKQANFGFIGKQLVCVDYASNLLMENGMKIKMVKANWLP